MRKGHFSLLCTNNKKYLIFYFFSFPHHSANHKTNWVFPVPSFPEIITCLSLSRENLIDFIASKSDLFWKHLGKLFGILKSSETAISLTVKHWTSSLKSSILNYFLWNLTKSSNIFSSLNPKLFPNQITIFFNSSSLILGIKLSYFF